MGLTHNEDAEPLPHGAPAAGPRLVLRQVEWSKYVDVVHRGVGRVARGWRLSAADACDLESETWLRLLEQDGRRIRQLRRVRHLEAYLARLARNVLLDCRVAERGKWRPCAAAVRGGAGAVLVDRLLSREGMSVAAATEWLRCARPAQTPFDVTQLAARLPVRATRTFVGTGALRGLEDARPSPFDVCVAQEVANGIARLTAALEQALQRLAPEDRLLLTGRYADGASIADLASWLDLPPKPLYRRFATMLRRVRGDLEAAGIDARAAGALLRDERADWSRGDPMPVTPLIALREKTA